MSSTSTRTPRNARVLCAYYLYSNQIPGTQDGTLIAVYDETRDGNRIGETADVILGYCDVAIYPSWDKSGWYTHAQPGRIVIGRYDASGFITLAKGGKVEAIGASLDGGSENTRKAGIEVQYTRLQTAKGLKLSWCETPKIISPAFTIQTGENYRPNGELILGGLWGTHRIVKVTDLRKPNAQTATA